MKNLGIVKKYAEALAGAVKDQREFEAVGSEIRAFLDLFVSREDLRRALVRPFVNARKRSAILEAVLARAGTGPKASRFLTLLLGHKRLRLLAEIMEALPEAWSEKHGIVTYEVTSAVALTDEQKTKLSKTLEASGKNPVRLVSKIDPAVVGGLALRKGNIVYDASVEGELTALKERLGQG
jgi:F-type H+-transporting ATPase subunit delta